MVPIKLLNYPLKCITICSTSIFFILSIYPKIVLSQDFTKTEKVSSKTKIGLNIGSYGIQTEYKLPLKEKQKISIKAGLFLMNFRQAISLNLAQESSLKIEPNFQSFGVSLKAERPLNNWLKIYFESRMFLKQKWQLNLSTKDGIDLNGLRIEASDFGQIDAALKWWFLQPGIGLEIGKNNTDKRINVSATIASFYMGSPKLNLSYEGFLETTTLQETIPQIENNMRNYSFYPAMSLNLTYRLTKSQK